MLRQNRTPDSLSYLSSPNIGVGEKAHPSLNALKHKVFIKLRFHAFHAVHRRQLLCDGEEFIVELDIQKL